MAPANRLAGLLAGPKIDVTRTCRYGHGPLWQDSRRWALVNHVKHGEPTQGFTTGQLHYRCAVWVCPQCGYMELSDTED